MVLVNCKKGGKCWFSGLDVLGNNLFTMYIKWLTLNYIVMCVSSELNNSGAIKTVEERNKDTWSWLEWKLITLVR